MHEPAPEGADPPSTHPLGGKTSVALLVMLALLAVPYFSPRLTRLRVAKLPWQRAQEETVAVGPAPASSAALTQGETTLAESANEGTVTNALPDQADAVVPLDPVALAKTKGSLAVEDETGRALDAFYARLHRTKEKTPGAITRVLHYGDSVITSDYISGTMRRKLQKEYGDAGHGFILVANPWEWYFHNDVSHSATAGWGSSRITGPLAKDGVYGLGGVTFKGSPGATATFGTPKTGDFGRNVSRFDVYYLEQPQGGDAEMVIGDKVERFSTAGDVAVSRKKSFEVPDGEAKATLRVVGNGPFRAFGVVLERAGPGIVYDALGANGARAELLAGIDAAHWREQMALRDPALVILQFGTNESEAVYMDPRYETILSGLIDKVKQAAPGASVLVCAPLDRADRGPDGNTRTKPIIKRLVAAQKKVAHEKGVGFWNTYEVMGGEGSMARWVKTGLGSGDMTHPTPAGAGVIGDRLFNALVSGYEAWVSRHPRGVVTAPTTSAAPSASSPDAPAATTSAAPSASSPDAPPAQP
ncbi:MAG: hypothetical protein KC657_00445 [Myxococcales bacterium]|nr:hypothetical protein [Myxococcales bacterium]